MKHVVYVIEYERGWGSKVDEVKEFDSKKEAVDFVNNFNAENDLPSVPDWYMTAQYVGTK